MELEYNIGDVVSYKHYTYEPNVNSYKIGVGFIKEIVLTNASPKYVVDDIRLSESKITNLYVRVENKE